MSSSADSILHFDDVRSGNSNDPSRVLAQKVHKYRSNRWIALKNFHEFKEAFLCGVAWNRYSTPTTSGRAIPSTRLEYQLNRSINIDHTVGSL